jgi:hypothetical protein
MKRQRGRGRKPGGGGGGGNHNNHNHGNRSLESNGPDVKIRGTAAQIYEKYSQYARDAQSGGDRVKYENYLQHAEHYYRVMAATMPRERLLQQQNGEGGFTPGQPAAEGVVTHTGEGSAPQQGEHQQHHEPIKAGDDNAADDGDDDAVGEEGEGGGGEEVEAGAREDNRNEGEQGERQGRNRRGRRRRRPQDGEQQGERSGGGDPEARSALDSLARKQGALAGG